MSRVIEVYKDYYWVFYDKLPKEVKTKIDYTLQVIISMERVSSKFLKHIEDGIYEIRIKSGSNIYRIFSFFDEGKLVILLHGFQKKSQKLPQKEISKAKKLRKMYYDEKK